MSQENVIPGTAKDRALLNFSLGDSLTTTTPV